VKQLVQNMKNGQTSVVEVPVPTPQPGTALVRTAASLVSAGTERMLVAFAEKSLVGKARSRPDLVRQVIDKARREGLLTTVEAALNRLDQPMPLGYASAGTIAVLGQGMEGFKVGDRVACAGGGYAVHAEYAVVPKNLLTPIPPGLDFEAAAFTTLGAIALHGFRLAKTQVGERVAVIGLGLLGLLMVDIAKTAGCHVFGVDLIPERVERAIEAGAEAVERAQAEQAALHFSHNRGVDAVLICADTTSDDPVTLAGTIARDRANVVAVGAVGLNIPRRTYFEKELNFTNSRSYGPGRYDPSYEEGGVDYPLGYVRWTEGRNLESVVEMITTGSLDVRRLITHRFHIEQAPEAYDLITGRLDEPFLGVLLTYEEHQDTERDQPNGEVAETTRYQGGEMAVSEPKPESVRLGVIGAGNFASAVMLPALARVTDLELVGIVSGSGLTAAHAARKFGFRYAAEKNEQVLSDPDINTVAILTRHNLHAEQVVAALNAGKHVFVEKPLAINRGQLSEIQQHYLKAKNQLLMVGFNRRFAPLAKKMKAFLEGRNEPLMIHYRINAGFLPPAHWLHNPEIGGGRIIGEACHFVDFLTYLVGETPSLVSAYGLPDAGKYREDNVFMTFQYPDGSIGSVSYLANGDKAYPKERVEVFSGGRVAVLDDYRSLEMIHQGRRRVHRSFLRQDKGHRSEWESTAAAILAGESGPIPDDHLFGVAEATFAALDALRCGKPTRIER
jgi:predicted dehydrogenase